jgi:Zn-dependent peptidase ImmA (M78 family)
LPNLVHLLESRGIRVYSLVHQGADFDAFSVWYGGIPFVFLNTTVTTERSRMDAGHELGHLVLHAHTGGGATKTENDEASAFASAFLMPAAQFLATAPQRVSLATVLEAKLRWGVSALAYVRRLHVLGRISDWHYKSLCIDIKTKYRNTEPGKSLAKESSKVLAWVFSSPDSGVSRRDAARHLRIPMSDLDEMTFGLTLTPMAGGGGATTAPADASAKPTLRLIK